MTVVTRARNNNPNMTGMTILVQIEGPKRVLALFISASWPLIEFVSFQ